MLSHDGRVRSPGHGQTHFPNPPKARADPSCSLGLFLIMFQSSLLSFIVIASFLESLG